MAYPIYSAPVRDAATGELNQALVGQEVQIVTRATTTPYPIQDVAGDPIPDSIVTVQSSMSTPTVYVDTETPPESLYLDWYHAGSGTRGPVDFEEVLRNEARVARQAAEAAAASAAELDLHRMALAGPAFTDGATFWGKWTAGNEPTPPDDGRFHWGWVVG
jgi:hypothetical protein